MNKKSFLRGFGTGVLFAATVLGISFTVRTSDSYVADRAKKLGMVYAEEKDSGLNLAKTEPSAAAAETPKVDNDNKETVTPSPKATQAAKATPGPTEASAKATAKPNSKKDQAAEIKKQMEDEKKQIEKDIRNEMKNLTINAGDWSMDVSKKLQSLGIVKNAKDFDKYLNDNGYSSSIIAGTYPVSASDTYNELARKITGK